MSTNTPGFASSKPSDTGKDARQQISIDPANFTRVHISDLEQVLKLLYQALNIH